MSQPDPIASELPDLLIVPLDGSTAAERAIPAAIELATQMEIPVRVVQVFDSIRHLRACAIGEVEWSADAEPRAVINPPAATREAVYTIGESGAEVSVIGRVGNPAGEIIRELALFPGAWIVMSTLGSTGLRRLFIGSTAREVIRTSTRPVLLIPAQLPIDQAKEQRSSNRVAVFLDGSAQAESSICHAAAFAETFGLDLDLVRVAETYRDDPDRESADDARWEEPEYAATTRYLNRVAQTCGQFTVPVNQVTLSGSPNVQLTRYVGREAPGLVTISTRKRSGIERWTYGSLAERLVDTLTLPLLLVPASED